jgi:hypothetical protein
MLNQYKLKFFLFKNPTLGGRYFYNLIIHNPFFSN